MNENGLFDNCNNPLLNPLIVNHILNYLEPLMSSKDRANFRTVCTLWNKLTFSKWRSNSTLKIGPPLNSKSSFSDFQKANNNQTSTTQYVPIDEFIYKLGNPHSDPHKLVHSPFSSYSFHSINFGDSTQFFDLINSPDYSFWGIFTPLCKSLTLQACTIPGDNVNLFEHLLIPHFRTIQKLILKDILIHPKRPWTYHRTIQPKIYNRFYRGQLSSLNYLELNGGRLPIDPTLLLLIAPNITHFKIRNSSQMEIGFSSLYTFTLMNCNDPMYPNPLKIQKLDVIHSSFFDKTYHPVDYHLGKFEMPLEYLSLNLEPYMGYYPNYRHFEKYDHFNDQDIRHICQPFLNYQSKTLKIAKIFRPPVFAMSNLPAFPEDSKLELLTQLYLWGNLVDSFSFLKSTPNLKILHIETKCISKVDQMNKMFYPNNESKEIEVFRERFDPFLGDFMKNTNTEDRESIMLPCLTELYIGNGFECEQSVETLARWMPHLNRFWGTLRSVDFVAVCKHMDKLEELGILLESSGIDDGVLTEGTYNLKNLTELKRFVYKSQCGQSLLGDGSIYKGFLQMTKLTSVQICVSGKMSQKAETDLKNSLNDAQVIRNYDSHTEWECCAYDRFKKDVLAISQ